MPFKPCAHGRLDAGLRADLSPLYDQAAALLLPLTVTWLLRARIMSHE